MLLWARIMKFLLRIKFKKIKNLLLYIIILFFSYQDINAQFGTVQGRVKLNGNYTESATIYISNNTSLGASTNSKGFFKIKNIPLGTYNIYASYIGYQNEYKKIIVNKNNQLIEINFDLLESSNSLNEVVITGTKTFKNQNDSPIMVNVLNSKTLNDVQACNLSDGLIFQTGLRVETNCQTCNYTQLRMNGLAGGYSQILINGRPIFSPLTGLYGLEQLPANMIERIEVVRGGGSSLYGSSAIGGTVNVITKVPKKNSYEINSYLQNINNKTNDKVLSANISLVSKNKNSGLSLFYNHRNRGLYDHNNDNFSEIPELNNNSIGINLFILPKKNQKLEINLSNLNEFRFGGEMVNKQPHLTKQSEERIHDVWMGSLDYQLNFNNNSSFIAYFSFQNTYRKHYTGIFPDDSLEIKNHILNPPYGTSKTRTIQGGIQINHEINKFFNGINTLTFGSEYVFDDVFDEIGAYNYMIDQSTKNLGLFLQSDWEISSSFTLLSGIRMDYHNLVDNIIYSPRSTLLYKYNDNTQFRLNYGTGFRAPQAFDTDLHIAFSGGGVSRVSLSPKLISEKSKSFSASINYDKPMEKYIVGFTLEGFYTHLNNSFFLQPKGKDKFGQLFEKQNGQGATVEGITLELRTNYNQKIQLETGFTNQSSIFNEEVEYINGLDGLKEFIRTPKNYGFSTLSILPNGKFNANLNYVYTGKMKIPHFSGSPNQLTDEIITSKPFSVVSMKIGYKFTASLIESKIEIYSGIKNILNSYQNRFDVGKNRDSNFVFGPSIPRTVYFGVRIQSK